MIVPPKLRLKNTIKYPTSLIIGGLNELGLQIADSLIRQGGYVVIVDNVTEKNIKQFDVFDDRELISFLDYTAIPHLEEDIRRLDYVFYFGHDVSEVDNEISTQEFLTFSNYLDATLSLAVRFDARFLLTTSIKAHQVLFSSQSAIGNDFGLGSKITKTYTEMEIQRYAEGLAMEYFNKVELNVKIVRLGEIIGEGMDFGSSTAFIRLLKNAVNGKHLELKSDGLETEWFVQIYDAVYGIIKAQFAKQTVGKVFSLAYENTYTHLSIAYKIQELEPNAKEIRFVENDVKSPPLRIHKSAPNLGKIGWMPRVSFDKAVRQALASAKIYLMERSVQAIQVPQIQTKKVRPSLGEQFKSFINFGNSKKQQPIKNPVDQIVEDKKLENEIKKEKLLTADRSLRLKKLKRNKSFFERLEDLFWGIFIQLGNTFSFVKTMSPAQLGIFTVFIAVFFVTYFTILAPLLVIVRAGLISYSDIQTLQNEATYSNFTNYREEFESVNRSIADSKTALQDLDFAIETLGQGDASKRVISTFEEYERFSNGVNDINFALEGLNEYFLNYENNLDFVASNSSYLVTNSTGLNYSPFLSKIEDRRAFLNNGINKIKQSSEEISAKDFSILPNFIETEFQQANQKISEIAEDIEKLSDLEIIPEFVGLNRPRTYLIFLLDNSRPTLIGGTISAYALITFSNGGIADIELRSAQNLNPDFTQLEDEDFEILETSRFITDENENLVLKDIESIQDFAEFSRISKNIFNTQFARDIDFISTVNISALETISENLNINYSSRVSNFVQSNDLLQSINSATANNESIERKNDLLSQIFAVSILEFFNSIRSDEANFIELFDSLLSSNDLQINSDVTNFEVNEVDEYLLADSYLNINYNLLDERIININNYSQISLDLNTVVGRDEISHEAFITFPNLGSRSELSVCLPTNTKESSILVNDGSLDVRFVANVTDLNTCVVIQILAETSVKLEWEVLNNADEEVDIVIPKISGINTQINHTISFIEGINPNSVNQDLDLSSSSIRIVKDLLQDDFLIFELE